MKLMLYVGNEGITDAELRDGDIFQTHPDSWEPGDKEKQRFLVVQVPDYPGDVADLTASEYMAGPGNSSVIRRMRKYRVDYPSKLSPEDLASTIDRNVVTEPILGLFSISDIVRK